MTNLSPKVKNKLTVPESRLFGSEDCQNCGTELKGPYCHYCGQPDKNFFRFFPALLREMMGDLLDFDSRISRTLKPLLFKPGKLATDYMQGRRFRYTSPVRLYLFSSITFFVLAGFIANQSINEAMGEMEFTGPSSATSELIPPTSETELVFDDAQETTSTKHSGSDGWWNINMPKDDSGEPELIDLPFVPDSLNNWVNTELAKSEIKSQAINEDPTLITSKIFDLLPMTIFALLPIFALLLKGFYLFSKRYYTEHLIFAMYNHSFIFVLATIMLLFVTAIDLVVASNWISESGWIHTAAEWATNLMWIWLAIYFWIAMKRYYQQGWLLTSIKYVFIGLFYTILIATVSTFIALISFLLL